MKALLRLVYFIGFVTGVSAFAQTSVPAAAPAPALGAGPLKSPPLAKKIVIIGGKKGADCCAHDFPNGIPLIAAWLKASPAFAAADVLTFTGGWPADPAAIEGASTIVLYFDGATEIPASLLDPARIALLQKQMEAGTGLIALHQASAVPAGDTTLPLLAWLGAKPDGATDRPEQTVTLAPLAPGHPITSGVGEFTTRDKFYPTLVFAGEGVTPILRAPLASPSGKTDAVLAWAYERAGGGRSFGYAGGHFLSAFEEPRLRRLLVNAIAWTARIDVPATGIPVPGPIVGTATVNARDDNKITEMPWGQLRWFTSAELGNSRTMTTGVAIIKPGKSNPVHLHPNCDEVLHVVRGKIIHTMNEVSVEMKTGDTVSIPQGVLHNATNIGDEDAVLGISFSSAYREAVGY